MLELQLMENEYPRMLQHPPPLSKMPDLPISRCLSHFKKEQDKLSDIEKKKSPFGDRHATYKLLGGILE